MTDIMNALTNWLKTHPVVSFILTLGPVFGIALGISNTFYQSTIDEYRSQIDVLKSTGTLVSTVQNTKFTSSGDLLVDSNCGNEYQKSHPAIKDLHLIKDRPELIWDGEVKVLLTKILDGSGSVNIILFIGELKQEFVLHSDSRETFSVEGHNYFLDLLSIYNSGNDTDDASYIAITPKNTKAIAYRIAPSIELT
jgi:hypothetical protein